MSKADERKRKEKVSERGRAKETKEIADKGNKGKVELP